MLNYILVYLGGVVTIPLVILLVGVGVAIVRITKGLTGPNSRERVRETIVMKKGS